MAREDGLEEPQARLDGLTSFEAKLVNLLALHLVHERQQSDQIDLLARAGFRPIDIAALLDTTRNNVSVRLAERRREKRKGGKAKKRKG